MKNILIITAALALMLGACKNEGGTTKSKTKVKTNLTLDKDSEKDKFSYSLGSIIATTLKNNQVDSVDYGKVLAGLESTLEDQAAYGIGAQQARQLEAEKVNMDDLNKDIILKGIYDVLEGDSALLNVMEVNAAYTSFLEGNKIRVLDENLKASKAYLENNLSSEGVRVTESGLQHQLIEEGTGEAITDSDIIAVHYTGTTTNGKEFDSSTGGEPYTVDLSADPRMQPIAGFKEALTLYPIGSKYRIFVPSNLGYGETPPQGANFGPNEVLIFELENVKKVTGDEAKEFKSQQAAYLKQLEEMQKQRAQQQGR